MNRRWLALIFAGAALLYTGSGFLPGRVLVPLDLFNDTGAWKAQPGARRAVSNHLLSDAVLQFVPWDAVARRALLAGRIPWTNPDEDGGAPFWANPVTALLSPFTWPRLAAGAGGWALSVFFKLVVAGLGAWWLARSMGAGPLAAAISGLVFLSSGFSVVWGLHPQTAVFAFLPWLAGAMVRLTQRITPAATAAAVLAAALATAGGHPETLAISVAGIFAFVLWEGAADVSSKPAMPGRAGRIGWAGAAAAIGFLLVAVQWIPFSFVLREARATVARRAQPAGPFRVFALPGSVLPGFLGSPLAGELDLTGAVPRSENFNVRSQAFVGAVALLCIVLAGRRLPRPFLRGLAVGAAALLVAWRAPPLGALFHAVPLFGLAAPEYASAVFVLFAAAASGPALVAVARGPRRRGTAVLLLAAGGGLALAGIAVASPPLQPWIERAARRGIEALKARGHLRLDSAVYAARLSGYLAAARWTALRRAALPGFCWALAGIALLKRSGRGPLLALAAGGELFAFGAGYLPSVRTSEIPADPPAITAIRRLDPRGEYSMIATGDDYPANLATLAGVRDLRSYDVLVSRADVSRLVRCGYDELSAAFPPSLSASQTACLADSGVRWVVSRQPAGERRVGGESSPGVGLYEIEAARRPPPPRDGPPRGFRAGLAVSAAALLAGIALTLASGSFRRAPA
jgi:hypothetical protein